MKMRHHLFLRFGTTPKLRTVVTTWSWAFHRSHAGRSLWAKIAVSKTDGGRWVNLHMWAWPWPAARLSELAQDDDSCADWQVAFARVGRHRRRAETVSIEFLRPDTLAGETNGTDRVEKWSAVERNQK